MKSAVIITNFNNGKMIIPLVNRINKFPEIDVICVVDNCSMNDDYSLLKKYFLNMNNVLICKTEKNGGYSFGNNYGVRLVNKLFSNVELFYICNPDVIFPENVFTEIDNFFESSTDLYACSCLRTDGNGKFTQKQTWKISDVKNVLLGHFALYRKIKSTKACLNIPNNSVGFVNVDLLPGSFFAIKSSFIKDFGYFDENVFLYCEEAILFKKLNENGKRVSLLLNCKYLHNHRSSNKINYKNVMNLYKIYQNSKQYYLRTYLTKNIFLLSLNKILSKFDIIQKGFITIVKKIFYDIYSH